MCSDRKIVSTKAKSARGLHPVGVMRHHARVVRVDIATVFVASLSTRGLEHPSFLGVHSFSTVFPFPSYSRV
jgi:hypothetical protein